MKDKKPLSLPSISPGEFWRRLKKRRLEDVSAIRHVEEYFQKKRGYIFRLPPPGTPVIHLVSGGIDSTVAWYLLAQIYRLDVYPLFVCKLRSHPQERSVAYFSGLYRTMFAERYHAPLIVRRGFIPRELEDILLSRDLHGETLLDYYDPKRHRIDARIFVGLNALSAQYGALYGIYLWAKHRILAQTLFCAVTARDGIGVPSQTLTSIRTTLLSIVSFYNTPTFQYASLFFEKETGWFAAKRDIIRIGAAAGIPLEKTYSCYVGSPVHCGECMGCGARRHEFRLAEVQDRTVYEFTKNQGIANISLIFILKKGLLKVKRLFSVKRIVVRR